MHKKYIDIIIIIGTFPILADGLSEWVTLSEGPAPNDRVKDATILIRLRGVEQLKGECLILQRISIQEGIQEWICEHCEVSWWKKLTRLFMLKGHIQTNCHISRRSVDNDTLQKSCKLKVTARQDVI